MVYPLIILENHCLSSARNFIADNAKTLKLLGYTKFLLEMDSTLSPKDLIKQLSLLCSNSEFKKSQQYESTVALLKMLNALEDNALEYEFIDPETQKEGLQQINDIKNTSSLNNENNNAEKRRIETSKQRDEKIAPIIIKQAKQYNGGVFYLGGYMHHHLVHLLESSQSNHYRYAIFSNSTEHSMLKGVIQEEEYAMWNSLSNSDNRLNFYNTYIRYFDMKSPISFELIESTCHLTSQKQCKKPMIDDVLSNKLGLSFDFNLDEHYVANATLNLNAKQAKEQATLIQKTFPKLSFFMKHEGEKITLTIPGTNLNEQQHFIMNKK